MKSKNLIFNLQKQYSQGGYALVEPQKGEVLTFAKDIKNLYKSIKAQKIDDSKYLVTFIPPSKITHAFRFSVSIRAGR